MTAPLLFRAHVTKHKYFAKLVYLRQVDVSQTLTQTKNFHLGITCYRRRDESNADLLEHRENVFDKNHDMSDGPDGRPWGHENVEASSVSVKWQQSGGNVSQWVTMREKMREKYGLSGYHSTDSPLEPVSSAREVTRKSASNQPEKETSNSSSLRRKLDSTRIQKKFPFLRQQRGGAESLEKVMETSYGLVRLDSDNQKRQTIHEEELPNERVIEADLKPESTMGDNTMSGANFIDESYFGKLEKQSKTVDSNSNNVDIHDNVISEKHRSSESNNYFDQQYFNSSKNDDGYDVKTESRSVDKDSAHNLFDEQYFGKFSQEQSNVSDATVSLRVEKTKDVDHSLRVPVESSDNYIEEQFFSNTGGPRDFSDTASSYIASTDFNVNTINFDQPKHAKDDLPKSKSIHGSALFDEQYFGSSHTDSEVNNDLRLQNQGRSHDIKSDKSVFSERNENEFVSVLNVESLPNPAQNLSAFNEENTIYAEGRVKKKRNVVANVENPKTAYDMAMKIRLENKGKLNRDSTKISKHLPKHSKWQGAVDSKGFRKLKNQVRDLQREPEYLVVNMLRDSILYEDDNIVAIDKPYGLPSHGGPGVVHSIGTVLPLLAQKISQGKLDNLHLVHRLDKETTGVMVLAKSEQVYNQLLGMFKRREVIKKYWVITKGVPNPLEGVIDIPMAEGTVGKYYRMALRPNYGKHTKLLHKTTSKMPNSEAITSYRVLDQDGTSALVECEPATGVKHQIRCHLAFALNTPILGDHKYSHFSKLAPQKLYPDTLQRLGIRQATVRYLPMHLHAHDLILPQFKNGRNLFLTARLPAFFVQNMKWLKLSPPK